MGKLIAVGCGQGGDDDGCGARRGQRCLEQEVALDEDEVAVETEREFCTRVGVEAHLDRGVAPASV